MFPEPAMTTILKECFSTVREGWKSSGFPTVIIATTVDSDKIPTGVLGSFKTELQIDVSYLPSSLPVLLQTN